jgi:hypothetical protein
VESPLLNHKPHKICPRVAIFKSLGKYMGNDEESEFSAIRQQRKIRETRATNML